MSKGADAEDDGVGEGGDGESQCRVSARTKPIT